MRNWIIGKCLVEGCNEQGGEGMSVCEIFLWGLERLEGELLGEEGKTGRVGRLMLWG